MPGATLIKALTSVPAARGGTADGTTETAFTNAAGTSALAYIPGQSIVANKPFRIRAYGRCTGGTTTNVTIAIYLQSATTLTSGNKVATTGAIACNSASGNWSLIVDAQIDSTSKKVNGRYSGWLNATAVAAAVISNQVSQDPTGADLPVMASSTFSASNSGNVATLDGLDIEF